jgi:hypothetical protein
MQNAESVWWAVEVTDKVVFRRRKPMKARHLAGSPECVACFFT